MTVPFRSVIDGLDPVLVSQNSLQLDLRISSICSAAEGVGFEPTNAFTSPVFKTGSIGRSDSPPGSQAPMVTHGCCPNLNRMAAATEASQSHESDASC
jgi:hypothetical protein